MQTIERFTTFRLLDASAINELLAYSAADAPEWDCFTAIKIMVAETSPKWVSGHIDTSGLLTSFGNKGFLTPEAANELNRAALRIKESLLLTINQMGLAAFNKVMIDRVGPSYMLTVFYDDVTIS